VIGLDTNVLVRYLAQDDPKQSADATRLIESLTEDDRGFVSLIVLAELHWVLRRAYGVEQQDVSTVVRRLLEARELHIQEPELVSRALARVTGNIDFADAVIGELGATAGCDYTATFDRGASQLPTMRLLRKR
jgi:predicted nucleic-acid-binding protein